MIMWIIPKLCRLNNNNNNEHMIGSFQNCNENSDSVRVMGCLEWLE
jgi:hypothetical protein